MRRVGRGPSQLAGPRTMPPQPCARTERSVPREAVVPCTPTTKSWATSCAVGRRAASAAGERLDVFGAGFAVVAGDGAAAAGAGLRTRLGGDESLSENSSETPVPAANAPTAASTSTSHARRRRLIADPLYRCPSCPGSWS